MRISDWSSDVCSSDLNDTEFSGEPMSETERYQLPFILPGRAQKEVYRNEALTRIDAALHAAVEEGPLPTPPQTPQIGESWIVARSEEHTSEVQSLMRISYAVFCLKKKKIQHTEDSKDI